MPKSETLVYCDLSGVLEYFNLVVSGELTPFGSSNAMETHTFLRQLIEGLGDFTLGEMHNLLSTAIHMAASFGVVHSDIPVHAGGRLNIPKFTDKLVTMTYNEFSRQIPEVEKMMKYKVKATNWGLYTLEVTYFD
jgi:hypothetical protein